MNFGSVLEALKAGFKVTRHEWHAAGMWLILARDTELEPHIDLHTPAGSLQLNWTPTQIDLLAEDWELA